MKYIKKYSTLSAYTADAENLDTPNVILIEDEMFSGGSGIITNAYIPVILDGSMIKWNATDGENRNSVDYPSISFDDAERLIYALNQPMWEVTATADYHHDDGDGDVIDWEDAEVTWELDNTGHPSVFVTNPEDDGEQFKICFLDIQDDVATIIVNKSTLSTATWVINYSIVEP